MAYDYSRVQLDCRVLRKTITELVLLQFSPPNSFVQSTGRKKNIAAHGANPTIEDCWGLAALKHIGMPTELDQGFVALANAVAERFHAAQAIDDRRVVRAIEMRLCGGERAWDEKRVTIQKEYDLVFCFAYCTIARNRRSAIALQRDDPGANAGSQRRTLVGRTVIDDNYFVAGSESAVAYD